MADYDFKDIKRVVYRAYREQGFYLTNGGQKIDVYRAITKARKKYVKTKELRECSLKRNP